MPAHVARTPDPLPPPRLSRRDLCRPRRFFADVWMLFPKESEYMEWFTKAGFTDVKITRIGPKWYRGVRRHGLIMGCSVTGVKPQVRTGCNAITMLRGGRVWTVCLPVSRAVGCSLQWLFGQW